VPKNTDDIPQPAVQSDKVTDADMTRIMLNTKAALDLQPKVQVRLPRAGKNETNYETVQINGYTYQIMRGADVQVPLAVREILIEANLL
jgi:hypothetical protein